MTILKSEAIKRFLLAKSHADMAALYHKGMECQVLMAKDKGETIDISKVGGRNVMAHTDGVQTWKSFRIPFKASSEPEDNDGQLTFNLEEHVEGIGLTGWDWQNRVSKWVAYDFDAMLGHSDKHQKKLSDAELLKVQEVVTALPYVTIRKSTSGRGIHLYIFLDNVPTANHTEHAALARSLLSMIAGLTGYNFTDKVDICVPASTWVQTEQGPKLVKDLINKPSNMLVDGKLYKSSGFYKTGTKQLYKLSTKEGYSVETTDNHPFLVSGKGWTELKDIKTGDEVYLNNHQNIEWGGEGSEDEGYQLGFIFGDGYIGRKSQTKIYLYPTKFVCENKLKSNVNLVEGKGINNSKLLSGEGYDKLVNCYKVNNNKLVTEELHKSSSEFQKGFIAGLFDSDGCVSDRSNCVILSQCNLPLLEDVQRILLRFGMVSSIRLDRKACKMKIQGRLIKTKDKYTLTISRDSYEVFVNTIPCQRIKHKTVKHRKGKSTFLVTVDSINPTTVENVFDITVEGKHAFDANGFYVHNCGGNMWVWHRKMLNTDGLKLVRQGEILKNIPANWKDHTPVVTKSSKRASFQVQDMTEDAFLELSGQRAKIKLDTDHRKLIAWLDEKGLRGWWNADDHMLATHTAYLKEAHKELNLRGDFHTLAQGQDYGDDINCFMFPCRGGVWAVRKFGIGTKEHAYWIQDGKGYTRCYFNRELTLDDAARLAGAVELERGGYQFKTCEEGRNALLKIKIECELPAYIMGRSMCIREARNEYKIVVIIPKEPSDDATQMQGWLPEKNTYRRLFNNPMSGLPDEAVALGDYNNTVRHIISEGGEDLGWMLSSDSGSWRHEPVHHIRIFLSSQGVGRKDIDIILGRCVAQPWVIVNKPFEPEYPGDRQWNRSKARFRIAPSTDGELLSYPTWQRILDHCGRSLDSVIPDQPWCKENGIKTGGQYLLLWFACLVKHPQQPLPYLGLHGPQDSGKSTIHEAFCQYILAGGFMDGKTALTSQSNFNGELQDTILVTLEEMDLRKRDVEAKMKEWVTSPTLTIHIKGQTPYKAPNFTHYIQCVNDRNYIPVFAGDKRVTMLYVDSLKPEEMIPRRDLWLALAKEAPDFLAALLNTEVPDSRDRLMIPVINSADKQVAEYESMNPVEKFFSTMIAEIPGHYESSEDVYNTFITSSYGDGDKWSKNKFGASVPSKIVRGRISSTKTQATYYGNIAIKSDNKELPTPSDPWFQSGGVSLTKKQTNVPIAT